MLCCGDTVDMPKPDRYSVPHLWIIVTEPDSNLKVVIVNITKRKDHLDDTVVLMPGDHHYVKHPSVVFYQDARFSDAGQIEKAIEAGVATRCGRCSDWLLLKIQDGLCVSDHTPNKIRDFCMESWGRTT